MLKGNQIIFFAYLTSIFEPMDAPISVFAPATLSNLGSGFDILGVAVQSESLGDTVTARLVPQLGVQITAITGDGGKLPLAAEKNTAGKSVLALLRQGGYESKHGVELSIHKGLPLGSGLGSSAASACGAVFAVNELLKRPFGMNELVAIATEGELVASGSYHADNTAPCVYGGIVAVTTKDPLRVEPISLHQSVKDLALILAMPDYQVSTREARQVLPSQVDLKVAIQQAAHVAGLMKILSNGDLDLLDVYMTDFLAMPYRKQLYHGAQAMIEVAKGAGAITAGVSGAGPALFVLTRQEDASKVRTAMKSNKSSVFAQDQPYTYTISEICGFGGAGCRVR